MLSRSSGFLALVLFASAPAFAQETKRPPSDAETLTFDDLKNSLGDLEQKESKEEKDKREAVVQKNHDETLKIYSDALGKRGGEVQNVNRRLEVNKGLEGKYDRLLQAARNGLAATRAQFINRSVALKKSLEDGKISREAYDKLLEEDAKRFRNREKELVDDIGFYQEEHQNAQRSAKDLAVKKELMQFDPFGGGNSAEERAKPPAPGMEQKLKSTLAEVSGYGSRSVVDLLK